jgi:hypothetical protein
MPKRILSRVVYNDGLHLIQINDEQGVPVGATDDDVRKFAAADDLLEACQELVSWVDGRVSEDATWLNRQAGFLKSAYHASCRAIAKAT